MATLTVSRSVQTLSPITVPTNFDRAVVAQPRWQGCALSVHPPVVDGVATLTRGVWAITHTVSGLRAGTFHGTLKRAIALARVWDGAFDAALANQTAPLSLANWSQRFAWLSQCAGTSAVIGAVPNNHPDHADQLRGTNDARTVAPTLPTLPTLPETARNDDGAEQFPATPTLWPTTPGKMRFARTLPNGCARLRHPETGKPVKMAGDVAAFRNPATPLVPILKLWFAGRWFDVPTTDDLMGWSLDGVCETPDGSRVEPDAPTAWLSLLGVV
jgi:hypothetical protein